MKTVLIAILAVGGVFGVWTFWDCCSVDSTASEGEVSTAVFDVVGMTCGGCEVGVKMAVKKLDGIQDVEASYAESDARISYDPSKVNPEDIRAVIEKLGYEAKLQREPTEKKEKQ